jgi:protein-L-isoaspartate(D-aspartate) O-methyltransferase
MHRIVASGRALVLTGAVLLAAASPARADEYSKEREAMVRDQIAGRGVEDPRVLAAMREVPRHLLIPSERRRDPYGDHPVPIGYGQTISQPYIVGFMTEQLNLEPGDRVLEVGTGSGYQAAVLAHITTNVFSIEIVPELADRATKDLAELGYDDIVVRHADGYHGWKAKGPWDAIIVTAAAEHVPPPLVQQLKPGGVMCIPVGSRFATQYLLLVRKDAKGQVTTRNLMAVRFVPLTRRK